MQPDHYATLQVQPGASTAAIRSAYRRLAKEHHPDLNESAEAKARMQAINEAWAVLGNAAKRADFDRSRANPGFRAQQAAWSHYANPSPAPPPPRRPRPASAPPRPGPSSPGGRSVYEEEADLARFRGRVNARRPGPRHFTGDPKVDWYGYLGVRENASTREILAALAKKAEELRATAAISAEEFTALSRRNKEAWETLGNPHVRAEYDRARRDLRA